MIRQTSIQAYGDLKGSLGNEQRAVLSTIVYNPGRTDREIADLMMVKDPNRVRPRRNELMEAGHIVEAGKRECHITGRVAMTWRFQLPEERQQGRLF
tara:strand:- start:5711 stop:6001 length:291 start_codon:yes stop_codon:yes gene_type:complete